MIKLDDLPAYLRTAYAQIDPERKVFLDELRVNWAIFSKHISQLTPNELYYVLACEMLSAKQRPEFIARPFFRAIKLNRNAQWAEIQKILPGAGYRVIGGVLSRA